MVKTILALIFALLLGMSATCLSMEFLQMRWEIWAVILAGSGIGLGLSLYFFRPGEKRDMRPCLEEFGRFEREFKQALRGHLKVSILFWSYYYKKEKIKTLEEAKKEVFQDLKKEFAQVEWMEPLLEGIRQELAKYK